MASLALKGVHHGANHIPDKAFEKIPFLGPRYFRESDRDNDKNRKMKGRDINRERSPRENRNYDSDSYDSEDSDYDNRRPRRSYRRSEGKDRRRDRHDRDYESDQGPDAPRGYNGAPYFPPPPKIAVNEPQDQQSRGVPEGNVYADSNGYVPRPYNPNEYGEPNGKRDDYYSGYPQEQQPYTPPPPPGSLGGQVPLPQNASPAPTNPDASHHSSIADRYRPAGYDSQGRGSPNPNYPSALTPYAYPEYNAPGYNTYQPPYERDDDYDESPEPRSRRRSRSGSRKASRSRSRFSERLQDTKTKVTSDFEKHKKEIGVSALGALAGGIIGNSFSGKKNRNMGTLIGAALGGIGGGFYEKKHEDQKKRQKLERRVSRRESKDGYDSY